MMGREVEKWGPVLKDYYIEYNHVGIHRSLPILKLCYYLIGMSCCQLNLSFELIFQWQRRVYTVFPLRTPFLQLVLNIMSWLSYSV